MNSTASDPANRRGFYKRTATILFVPAALSTFILVLWRIFGPQSGMEELGIIFPWIIAVFIHVVVTVPALICAFKSRSHLGFSWLYLYFFLFWAFNGYLYVKMSGLDIAAQQKLHAVQKPQETALADLITRMDTTAVGGYPVDPSRLSEVKALILSGADVTYRPPGEGLPLICRAARIDDPELIRLMVSHGADVEGNGRSSASPLMRAVRQKHTSVVKTLLKLEADPNHAKYNPYTPLMTAVKQGDIHTVAVLLDGGAKPDLHPTSSIPPLQMAAGKGNIDIMALLLDAGADPNLKSFGWSTAMIRSVQAGCVPCVEVLIRAGGKAAGRTKDDEGVLMLARSKDLSGVLTLFKTAPPISKPGDRFTEDTFNDLFLAIRNRDWQGLNLFLDIGVPPDIRNEEGQTLLLLLASRNYPGPAISGAAEVKAATTLTSHGADPDITDNYGRTALIFAVRAEASEMSRLLINHGADVNHTTANQLSALHYAARKNDTGLVRMLLDAGAHPDAGRSQAGSAPSALNDAVKAGNPAIVESLLAAGASIDPARTDDANMLRRAVGSPELLSLFLEYGLALSRKDAFGRYPVTYAMVPEGQDALKMMISAGSPIYLEDWQGLQPLYFCAENGYADIIRTALNRSGPHEKFPPVYLQNTLRRAIRHGRIEAVKVLLDKGIRLKYKSELDTVLQHPEPPGNDPDVIRRIRELYDRGVSG